jgi:hypothetical protein
MMANITCGKQQHTFTANADFWCHHFYTFFQDETAFSMLVKLPTSEIGFSLLCRRCCAKIDFDHNIF